MSFIGREWSYPLLVPPHHLVTHGVVLGMTGSGKTGLLMVDAHDFTLWLETAGPADAPPPADLAQQLASERLSQSPPIRAFQASMHVAFIVS